MNVVSEFCADWFLLLSYLLFFINTRE